MRIKPRHVQDEAENRYFTVRILGQEIWGERKKERGLRVRVNERVKQRRKNTEADELDQVRGEFPRLSIRTSLRYRRYRDEVILSTTLN